ncbi:MAG: sulfatase [Alphaproteobacteria bacterium]|nr:sulfatase [Alphaproteobacteria bacterium]
MPLSVIRVSTCLLAASLLGWTACGGSTPDPEPASRAAAHPKGAGAEAADDDDAGPALEEEARTGGDPLTDPDDYSPMDPPRSWWARIAPTPLDAALPPVTSVPAADHPNVVLVIGCTVRRDQLTPYGAPDDVTPFLASLARDGTRFDDFLAAAPWTRVASTAILTGRHAVSIDMVEPSPRRNDRILPDDVTTLAEYLKDRGYRTVGATANPNLAAEFGFAQGYDVYQPGLPTNWKASLSATRVADAVLGALKTQQEAGDTRPFFARMMVFDAHAPRHAKGHKLDPYADPELPARIAQYRYHLHQLDEGLAHLDAGLKALGYDATNTVFVFVADHGEGMNFPDHHGFGHGQYFGSSTVSLPWLLRGPGVAVGNVVLGPASQVDVLPTILGLVGDPLPADAPTDGLDQSALIRGDGHVISRPYVLSDTWFGGSSRAAIFTPDRTCQADFGSTDKQKDKGKFVPGCFDRHADPLSATPIDDAPLMRTLVDWRHARMEAMGHGAADATLDPALAAQLEQLGYVDDATEKP